MILHLILSIETILSFAGTTWCWAVESLGSLAMLPDVPFKVAKVMEATPAARVEAVLPEMPEVVVHVK